MRRRVCASLGPPRPPSRATLGRRRRSAGRARKSVVRSRVRGHSLDPALQRRVHCHERGQGVAVQGPPHRWDQEPAEPLVLGEPRAATVQGLDPELVLGVEDPRQPEPALPTQPAAACGLGDRRSQRHRTASLRLHTEREPAAYLDLAFSADDERVPLRVRREVGEDLPHPRRAGVDVDLADEGLAHGEPPVANGVSHTRRTALASQHVPALPAELTQHRLVLYQPSPGRLDLLRLLPPRLPRTRTAVDPRSAGPPADTPGSQGLARLMTRTGVNGSTSSTRRAMRTAPPRRITATGARR